MARVSPAVIVCLAALTSVRAGQFTWYGDSQATSGKSGSSGAGGGEVYRPLTGTGSDPAPSMTSSASSQASQTDSASSSSGLVRDSRDAILTSFIADNQPASGQYGPSSVGSAPGGELPKGVNPFIVDSSATATATASDAKSVSSSSGTEKNSAGGANGVGVSFDQETYDLINQILGTSNNNEEDDDEPQIIIEPHHHGDQHQQQHQQQQEQHHQQQQQHQSQQQHQPQQQEQQQQQQQHHQQQQQQLPQQEHAQSHMQSSDDDAERVVAGILETGTTDPGSSGTVSIATSLDLAFQKYSVAARSFAQAQKKASDAELAVIKARETVSSAGGEAVSQAVASSRAAAITSIRSARASVRDDVSHARTAYVSAATRVHSKVTEMRAMEKRFRSLAVAFAKVRLVASEALIGLKRIKEAPVHPGLIGHLNGGKGVAYAHQFEVCKTKVKTMKAVEKQFIAVAKAYAKVRDDAKSCVRDVRKAAFNMAQTCAAGTVRVTSAVDLATEAVSKAITVAKATSMAKAVATVAAVEDDRDDAYDDLREAGLALGKARASLDAIVGVDSNDDDDDDSHSSSSGSGGSGAGTSGHHDASSSHAPSYPASYAPANIGGMAKSSSSDKTDTMARY